MWLESNATRSLLFHIILWVVVNLRLLNKTTLSPPIKQFYLLPLFGKKYWKCLLVFTQFSHKGNEIAYIEYRCIECFVWYIYLDFSVPCEIKRNNVFMFSSIRLMNYVSIIIIKILLLKLNLNVVMSRP